MDGFTDMTIPTEPTEGPTVIPPYVPEWGNVTNITPFTYRDGMTYLSRFERLVKYINRVVIPFVNKGSTDITDAFEAEVNRMIETVNEALAEQDASVDQKIAELTAYVDAAIASVIDGSVEIQDPLVAQMIADPNSATRQAGDDVWAPISVSAELDALEAIVNDGRLSQASMQASADTIAAEFAQVEVDLATKADKSVQDTVETGRLSPASVANAFELAQYASIQAKYGSIPFDDKFDFLHNGIVNPAQDTRVVILGGSDAKGHLIGSTSKPGKAAYERLNFRANAPSGQKVLDAVVSAPAPSGMSWWNGADQDATSGSFFPTATRGAALTAVQPRYVIIDIGIKDYEQKVSLATYKANVLAACQYIENASPLAIVVLVHSHGSRNASSPVAPYSEYGKALKEIVDLLPTRRFFVNLESFFTGRGSLGGDGGDLVNNTSNYLNDSGSLFYADVLGTFLGIPSETDSHITSIVSEMPFPAGSGVYTVENQMLTQVTVEAANFPREMKLNGSILGSFSVADGYYSAGFVPTVGPETAYIEKWPGVGLHSQDFTHSVYIAQGVSGQIQIRNYPHPPGTNTLYGTDSHGTFLKVTVIPV